MLSLKNWFSFLFFTSSALANFSVHDLSTEEKVGQVLMFFFQGDTANAEAKALIQELHVGNIIYYQWSNGLYNPEQVQKLSNDLQKLAKIPLFISVDQEGGVVNRLYEGFTVFPGNGALGKIKNPHLSYQSAKAIGEEMKAVGVNMNLAPVADVNSNNEAPVIGIRSFSSSPKIVAQLSKAALKGYKKSKVLATLKHFPGYGNVSQDPHLGLPTVTRSKEELEKVELYPFKKLVKEADAIMTAHIVMPALDKSIATLSKKIITDLLRNEWGYEGLIISDSLVMEGLLLECQDIGEAAVKAFLAGHDILCFGGKMLGQKDRKDLTLDDMRGIFNKLLQAVKTGEISNERLNQSVGRILKMKEKYQLISQPISKDEINKNISTAEHQALAKKIAHLAFTVKSGSLSNLSKEKLLVIAPKTLIKAIPNNLQAIFFEQLSPSLDEINYILTKAKESKTVLFFSYSAWRYAEQKKLIQALALLNKKFVLVAARDPIDTNIIPNATATIALYSPVKYSIEEVLDLLNN